MKRWILVVVMALVAGPAVAQQNGDTGVTLGFRGHFVKPSGSGGIVAGGLVMKSDSSFAPEVDATFRFHPNWGVELATKTFRADAVVEGVGKASNSRVFGVNAALQYRVTTGTSPLKPYVGVGLDYTSITDSKIEPLFIAQGLKSITASKSANLLIQAGLDVLLSSRWALNADVKYVRLQPDLTVMTVVGPLPPVVLAIHPWLLSMGMGYRF